MFINRKIWCKSIIAMKICTTNHYTTDAVSNNLICLKLTAIYAAHPALLVLAFESTSLPLIPKSHSFTVPLSSNKILEGFTSEIKQKYR